MRRINKALHCSSSARLSTTPLDNRLGYRDFLLERGDALGDSLGDGESERYAVLPGVPNTAVTTRAEVFDILFILPKHLDGNPSLISHFCKAIICEDR